MIVCVDVDYGTAVTRAALVGFSGWTSATTLLELVDEQPPNPAAYHPGAFYERELPYLLPLFARAALARPLDPIEIAIVDGYVWLAADRPGLGAHLYARLPVPKPGAIVGVAKTRFAGAMGVELCRGSSATPLHVTAIGGITPADAAAHVTAMHGPFRIPTLLKRVDVLARGRAAPTAGYSPSTG